MESHEINDAANNVALNVQTVLRSCVPTTNEGTYKSIGRLVDCTKFKYWMLYLYFEVLLHLAQFFCCYILIYINRLNCASDYTEARHTESINNRTKMAQTICHNYGTKDYG